MVRESLARAAPVGRAVRGQEPTAGLIREGPWGRALVEPETKRITHMYKKREGLRAEDRALVPGRRSPREKVHSGRGVEKDRKTKRNTEGAWRWVKSRDEL